MMGRPRSKSRVGWPANLYPNREGFKYRHPITKKESWMGKDRLRAFEAAKKLNALLIKSNDLVGRVVAKTETIADAIGVFRKEDMPGRGWKPATASVYESVLTRIEKRIGDREVAGFTVKDCATFIREVTESPRSRQQFRLVLSWIFACAIEDGWMDSNPALQTRKAIYKRERQRLTREIYEAIWTKAEPWLQNAMDLSLITLLRREDIVTVEFSDIRDGKLWVVPSKTEGTSGTRIRVKLGETGAEVIARCRDAIVSPFLIHRLPERARPQDKRAKERRHHTQVLPEQLTRAFADARDAAARERKDIDADRPPTFHEIRSLGAAMLRDAGWSKKQVQELLTHTDETMTDLYLGGHDVPWTDVEVGLALKR